MVFKVILGQLLEPVRLIANCHAPVTSSHETCLGFYSQITAYDLDHFYLNEILNVGSIFLKCQLMC